MFGPIDSSSSSSCPCGNCPNSSLSELEGRAVLALEEMTGPEATTEELLRVTAVVTYMLGLQHLLDAAKVLVQGALILNEKNEEIQAQQFRDSMN